MRVSRVRQIGLLLAVMLLVAIIASQLIANVGEAKVDPPRPPSDESTEDHNNWTPILESEPPT